MKRRRFFLLLTAVIVSVYILSSLQSVHKARHRAGIILSPDKSKSIEYRNHGPETQIKVNFHSFMMCGGSNLAVILTDSSNILVQWIDDDSIEVRYPKGTTTRNTEDHLKFFSSNVAVRYIEE